MYLRQTNRGLYLSISLYLYLYTYKKAEGSEVRADVNASGVEADAFASDKPWLLSIYLSLSLHLSLYIHKKASHWASEGSEVRADVNASATEADVFASDNRGFSISSTRYLSISLYIYIRRPLAGRVKGLKCAPT